MHQVEMISLDDLVPSTHSYRQFFSIRKRLDTHFLAKVFANLRDQLKQQGLINVFAIQDGLPRTRTRARNDG